MFWRNLFISLLFLYINFCGIVVCFISTVNGFKLRFKKHFPFSTLLPTWFIVFCSGLMIMVMTDPLYQMLIHNIPVNTFIIALEIAFAVILRCFRLDGYNGNLI